MGNTISRITLRAKEFSVLIKLTLSYIVLIILLVSSIGLTSYYLSSSNYNSEATKLNHQLLEQYSSIIQEKIINATEETRKKMVLDINLSTDIDILFEPQINLGDTYKLYRELNDIVNSSNNLYQGIHIYSKNNNIVLSSVLGIKYLDTVNPFSWANLIWVTEIPDMNSTELWRPTQKLSYETSTSTDVVSYITTHPSNLTFQNAKGYIKFDINESYLKNILANIDISGVGELFLIDNYGNLVSHSNDIDVPSTIYDIGYPDLDYFNDASSNNSIILLDNIETLVSFEPIGENWKLVRSIPVKDFNSVSRQLALSISVICIIVMIAAMILSQLFASKIYSPLKIITSKIKDLFSPAQENKKILNEYMIIDSALDSYNTQLLDLSKKWEDNVVNLKQNLLRNIVGNTISSKEDFNKRMRLIGQKNIDGYNNIILIHINDAEATEILAHNRDGIIDNIINFTESLNDSNTLFIASQMTTDTIISLVIARNPRVENKFKEILTYSSNTLLIDLDISIGKWHTNTCECNSSYAEAYDAYLYRFFMPQKNYFDFNEFDYSQDIDMKPLEKIYVNFSQALISDDNPTAQIQINSFVEFISSAELPLKERYKCVQSMTNLLYNYSKQYYVGKSDIDLTFHNLQDSFKDIYEYQAWLEQATYHVLELKRIRMIEKKMTLFIISKDISVKISQTIFH